MANRTCSIEGCETKHYGRGFCQRHYSAEIRKKRPADAESLAKARDTLTRLSGQAPGGCWLWTGATNANGYGVITANISAGERSHLAHRVAYIIHVGPIPDGSDVDHRCHQRTCVNPDHLRACTRAENMENRGHSYASSGVRGVYARPNGKWRVQAKKSGRVYQGGTFDDLDEAAEAARLLRLRLFTHNDLDRIERT